MGKTHAHKHWTQRQWNAMMAGPRNDPEYQRALESTLHCDTCSERMIKAIPTPELLAFARKVLMEPEHIKARKKR